MVTPFRKKHEKCKQYKYYLRNPYKLIEDMLGVKLQWWERLYVKFFSTKQLDKATEKYIYGSLYL